MIWQFEVRVDDGRHVVMNGAAEDLDKIVAILSGHKALLDRVKAAEAELADCRHDFAATHNNMRQYQAENLETLKDLAAATQRAESAARLKTAYRRRVEAAEAVLSQTQAERDEWRRRTEAAEVKVEQMRHASRRDREELVYENTLLLTELEATLAQCQQERDAAVAENVRLLAQVEELQAKNETVEAKLDLMRSEAELLGTYLSEATAEQAALWKRTKSILEVAIARGEKLGYSDDDYRALWRDLTGADWQDEPDELEEDEASRYSIGLAMAMEIAEVDQTLLNQPEIGD